MIGKWLAKGGPELRKKIILASKVAGYRYNFSVSFAEDSLFNRALLQKRHVILRSLLI